MKLRFTIIAFGLCMAVAQTAQAGADAVGVWLTDEGKAKVRLSECGDRLCSEIIWLREPNDERGRPLKDYNNPDPNLRRRPIMGMEILQGLQPAGPSQWSGEIYNPENGKLYKAHLTVGREQLRLKGCVSWGWPCGEQTWMRLQEKETQSPRHPRAPAEQREARAAPTLASREEASERPAGPPQRALSSAAPMPWLQAAPADASPAVTGSVKRGGEDDYLVQVAARQSENEALSAFTQLQQQFPDLLGPYKPLIQMADLGAKGVWYRVRIGPMQQKMSAATLCERLKSAGGDCIVRRQE